MITRDLVPGTGIKPFAIMRSDRKFEVIGVLGTGATVYATLGRRPYMIAAAR
jgi:hypothetical protein